MILQLKLAHVLNLVAQRRSAAHGFVRDRSIVTNAKVHSRKRWVLNVDLKDFFPSIHFGRVRGMFSGKPYLLGERAATGLAQLCCHQNQLPQGAPTSPIISNMVSAKLDGELHRLAHEYGCIYSRYADDLTFSTNSIDFPTQIAASVGGGTGAAVGPALRQVIESNRFEINFDKVRLQSGFTRQQVTGLIVNRRPNVPREFVSQIRSMLHAWEKYGYDLAETEFRQKYDNKHRPFETLPRLFERVIRGKLAFLKQVRGVEDRRYVQLRRRLGRMLGEIVTETLETPSMEYDVFICHASEDKAAIVRPLASALTVAGLSVWVDETEITWGDSVTGLINDGLSKSRFVILVLSASFLKKRWPVKEMNAVLSKEISSGVTRALSLMVGTDDEKSRILAAYPLLGDKHYLDWSPGDLGTVVSALKAKL